MERCQQAREEKSRRDDCRKETEAIRRLIAAGSDPWEQVAGGLTALFFATGNELTEIIRILLNAPLPEGPVDEFFQKKIRVPYEIAIDIGKRDILQLFEQFAVKHSLNLKALMVKPAEREIPALLYLPLDVSFDVEENDDTDPESDAEGAPPHSTERVDNLAGTLLGPEDPFDPDSNSDELDDFDAWIEQKIVEVDEWAQRAANTASSPPPLPSIGPTEQSSLE